MQHMPFLRSKFRIKKKTGPTKTGTLRNSHAIDIGERANKRRSLEKAKFHLACERALCFAFPSPQFPARPKACSQAKFHRELQIPTW